MSTLRERQPDKSKWNLPQWQAYVAQGQDKSERNNRLEEVPLSMRESVVRHVQTLFAIRKYKTQTIAKRKRSG